MCQRRGLVSSEAFQWSGSVSSRSVQWSGSVSSKACQWSGSVSSLPAISSVEWFQVVCCHGFSQSRVVPCPFLSEIVNRVAVQLLMMMFERKRVSVLSLSYLTN